MDILDRIDLLRIERGWSKSELLRRVGLPNNAIAEWAKGRNRSYLKHLSKIADALGTSSEFLRGETEDPSPPTLKALAEEVGEDIVFLARKMNSLAPDKKDLLLKMLDAAFDAIEAEG